MVRHTPNTLNCSLYFKCFKLIPLQNSTHMFSFLRMKFESPVLVMPSLQWLCLIIMLFQFIACKSQSVIPEADLSSNASKWFQSARAEAFKGNDKKAHELYDKVIKNHPDYVDAYLMKGGLYYEKGQWPESAIMFEKAISIHPDHNKEVYFSLGIVAEKQKKYRKAVHWLEEYHKRILPDDQKYDLTIEKIRQNKFRSVAIENPVPFNPVPLPEIINTKHSEYTPLFTADGTQMIFVRRENMVENLYVVDFDGANFSEPRLIEEISTQDNEGVHTISADGRVLIFTACNRRTNFGSCDLWYTLKRTDGKWAIPVNMGNVVNSAAWDAQPSLSADGQTLYFSSTRQGGIGGRDIWVTKRNKEGRWITPYNIGGEINSLGDEETPFIHADGRTLYFRSNGHLGMGGFDAFMTSFDRPLQRWEKPTNLGYPINTEFDEGGLSVSLDGQTAYFASDRNGNQVDIYQFDLYESIRPDLVTYLKIKVKDADSGTPLITKVTLVKENDGEVFINSTDQFGTALYALPTDDSYGIHIEKEGYLFFTERIHLDSMVSAIEPIEYDVRLIPVKKTEVIFNQPIILKNIQFEINSSELLSSSFLEINKLALLLSENADWNILLTGHTDSTGNVDFNLDLSKRRAEAVLQALTERGIQKERISTQGLGDTQPIASNGTPDGRRLNRRTEMTLQKNGY